MSPSLTAAKSSDAPSMTNLAKITPALTTTFKPKATTCTENRLTMLANKKFQIWNNEPVPVPGSTFRDCYPSQFIESYTLLGAKVTQPAFQPLICPENYSEIGPYTSNYIVCCPSSYKFANPTDNPFSNRPGFGGTCYSPIYEATPILVTAYGTTGITATVTYSATVDTDQVYAHPYEGFAFGVAQVQSIIPSVSSTSTSNPPSSTTSAAAATYTVLANTDPVFTPNTVNAQIGDVVLFQFLSGNHSVTQSSFNTPCVPVENGLDSGYMSNINSAIHPAPEFSYEVSTNTPRWFYSKQSGECGDGMTFALNPTSEQSQASFQQAAITQNGTNFSTPVSKSSSGSGLSTGAKAGISLGVSIPVILIAILAFFFFVRRRKQKAKAQLAQQARDSTPAEYYATDVKVSGEENNTEPSLAPSALPRGPEVHGDSMRGELPGYEPAEMPTTRYSRHGDAMDGFEESPSSDGQRWGSPTITAEERQQWRNEVVSPNSVQQQWRQDIVSPDSRRSWD